jgi:hypothetical protein
MRTGLSVAPAVAPTDLAPLQASLTALQKQIEELGARVGAAPVPAVAADAAALTELRKSIESIQAELKGLTAKIGPAGKPGAPAAPVVPAPAAPAPPPGIPAAHVPPPMPPMPNGCPPGFEYAPAFLKKVGIECVPIDPIQLADFLAGVDEEAKKRAAAIQAELDRINADEKVNDQKRREAAELEALLEQLRSGKGDKTTIGTELKNFFKNLPPFDAKPDVATVAAPVPPAEGAAAAASATEAKRVAEEAAAKAAAAAEAKRVAEEAAAKAAAEEAAAKAAAEEAAAKAAAEAAAAKAAAEEAAAKAAAEAAAAETNRTAADAAAAEAERMAEEAAAKATAEAAAEAKRAAEGIVAATTTIPEHIPSEELHASSAISAKGKPLFKISIPIGMIYDIVPSLNRAPQVIPVTAPVAESPAEVPAVTPVAESPAEVPAVTPVAESPAEVPAVTPVAESPAESPVAESPAAAPAANVPIKLPVYHQRQDAGASCGRNTLNNLLGDTLFVLGDFKNEDTYTDETLPSKGEPIDLHKVCRTVREKTVFGNEKRGYCKQSEDHDIMVLGAALAAKGYMLETLQLRANQISEILKQKNTIGFVVNQHGGSFTDPRTKVTTQFMNHWVAFKKANNDFMFKLDSLSSEKQLMSAKQFEEYMTDHPNYSVYSVKEDPTITFLGYVDTLQKAAAAGLAMVNAGTAAKTLVGDWMKNYTRTLDEPLRNKMDELLKNVPSPAIYDTLIGLIQDHYSPPEKFVEILNTNRDSILKYDGLYQLIRLLYVETLPSDNAQRNIPDSLWKPFIENVPTYEEFKNYSPFLATIPKDARTSELYKSANALSELFDFIHIVLSDLVSGGKLSEEEMNKITEPMEGYEPSTPADQAALLKRIGRAAVVGAGAGASSGGRRRRTLRASGNRRLTRRSKRRTNRH